MAQAYRLAITLEAVNDHLQAEGEKFSRVRLVTLLCASHDAMRSFEREVAYLASKLTAETVRDAMAVKVKAEA